jgi:CheY-like chemotaxis protein
VGPGPEPAPAAAEAPAAAQSAPAEPTAAAPVEAPRQQEEVEELPLLDEVSDDQGNIGLDDRVLLIVENDPGFARFLVDMAHENSFKALVATRGTQVLTLARRRQPHAITLDINLPDIDGWRVLSQLKECLDTRHIPVQIISTEDERERGLRMGAMGVLRKPVKTKEVLDETFAKLGAFLEPRRKTLLLLEPREERRSALMDLLKGKEVDFAAAATAKQALKACKEQRFDAMVLSHEALGGGTGSGLPGDIKKTVERLHAPVIFCREGNLPDDEEERLKSLARLALVKEVSSPERLLDETALILHHRMSDLRPAQREMIERIHRPDQVLPGKKVLVVDDDIRNIFAMTSILEPHKVKVLSAENGKQALAILERTPGIDIVLMDIMMPDMDGYSTIQALRNFPQFRNLPVIALTAKAMKGDREKCIEAGASDYISKPVDTNHLLALLHAWLHR